MQSKKLLLTTFTALCIGNSMADHTMFHKGGTTIAIGGEANVSFGFRDGNKGAGSLTPNNRRVAQDTSAAVHASVAFPKFYGWKYGAQVGISTTTINDDPAGADFFERSYIYTENPNVGRVEFGTRNGASRAMRIHAGSIAVAYGGVDGGWGNFVRIEVPGIKDGNFIDGPSLAIGEGSHNDGRIEKYRKLTLYSPLINGFKFGFSYGPDASNTGNRSVLPWTQTTTPASPIKDRAKDIVAGGISWEQKSGIQEVKLSVVGEYARYNSVIYTDETYVKYNPYKAVMVGGRYTYDNVSIAASYGNLFNSKIAKGVKPLAGSHVSTVGIKYDFGIGAASLGYLFSTKNKNTFHIASAGVEYKFVPGVIPYAEVTYIHAHQRRNYDKTSQKITSTNAKTSGTAFVVGTRIVF